MNKRLLRKITLGLVISALSLAPVLAGPGAGPGRGGPGHGPGGGFGMSARMADALDLTADQRAKVREIRAKYMGGALGNHMDAMHQARQALATVVRDPAATDEQVQGAAKAVSAEVMSAAVEGHHLAAEISAVLTPEQRAKASELRQQGRRGRHGPPLEGPDEF